MEKSKIAFLMLGLMTSTIMASIQIMHPKELKTQLGKDGLIKGSLGNFGHIKYGTSVLGRLHYPVNNVNGCDDFKTSDFSNDLLFDETDDLTPIIMVDRGHCSFVTKVRNIEKLGVKLAIIADDSVENTENLIMADDGTGHSINIPSFIIGKKDADAIKKFIKSSTQNVYIKAELEMVHPDNRVEYELWYSTILDIEYWRLYDIALYQKALNDHALFTPRIITYQCEKCSKEFIDKNCLAKGKYCALMPKEKLKPELNDVTPFQFLFESLNQKCLYKVLSEEKQVNSNYTKWFNYVLNFIDQCNDADSYKRNCSHPLMESLGINTTLVDKCIKNSLIRGTDGNVTDVTLFKEDRDWATKLGISFHPVVSINNITYRGDINGYDVFRAICAGFKTSPNVCKGDNVFEVVSSGDDGFINTNRHFAKVYHIVGAIVLVLILNCFALYVYRKYQKKKINTELQMQVNSAVSQYFRLSGQESSQI